MRNFALSLTPAKCELLDSILNEFDKEIYIKSERILKIFRGNGPLAADYLELLVNLNLVILVGQVEGFDLPAMVGKQVGVDMFISEGGFKRRHALNKLEEDAGKTIEDIQNEKLDLQEKILKQEQVIEKLEQELTLSEVKNGKNWWMKVSLLLAVTTAILLIEFIFKIS